MLLTGLIYGSRLGETPPSGEEPRRGQVAREMISSGDWIVPRQQGLPFLSRPPVQNWAIALVSLLWGKIDAVAIRLPSVAAILLTVTLIYAYGRSFLSRLGAMCAMLAFPTMGLVLQFGWLGETEALYTFVVAGSLIVWRWADAAGKSPLWGWCGGYGLAALGMLTKGPQAPAYFIGGVAIFLLVMRRGASCSAGSMSWALSCSWRSGWPGRFPSIFGLDATMPGGCSAATSACGSRTAVGGGPCGILSSSP